jgi:hypothetical protein
MHLGRLALSGAWYLCVVDAEPVQDLMAPVDLKRQHDVTTLREMTFKVIFAHLPATHCRQ